MSNSKPFITVLMATYNEKVEYISKAIDSILEQTYSNFEFLICDDSTNEETISVLNDYARKDKRIRIIRKETRMGFVKSLNEGVRQAKGDWIARMDSDDISFPNRFEEEIKYIGEDVGVIASQCINIDAQGRMLGRTIKTPSLFPIIKLYLASGKCPIVHPTTLIRSEFLNELGGYDDANLEVLEDYELWTRFVVSNYRIINIQKPLLYYRIHPNNAHIKKVGEIKIHMNVCLIKFALCMPNRMEPINYDNLLELEKKNILCKLLKTNVQKNIIFLLLRKVRIFPELFYFVLYLYSKFMRKRIIQTIF